MKDVDPAVFVIEDDLSMRTAVQRLVQAMGLRVETFGSGPEFLASQRPDVPSCLVRDVRLPGWSGLDLQRELAQRGISIPIIFITGHGDIPTAVLGTSEKTIKVHRGQAMQKMRVGWLAELVRMAERPGGTTFLGCSGLGL